MSRPVRSRHQLIDLLRLPQTTDSIERWSTALIVDPKAQLGEMVQLVEQGLVCLAQFDDQRRKISES
jgi:hypothetical protein